MSNLLGDDLRFRSFVVGPSNRFAWKAAARVGADWKFNPLLIYSREGLGKTHLLAAAHARLRARHPRWMILAFSTRTLRSLEDTRRELAAADALLLDDIQKLSTTRRAREQVKSTVLRFVRAGHPVIMAGRFDRIPRWLAWVTRLDTGLVADIGEPEHGTRTRLFRRLGAKVGLDFESACLRKLADAFPHTSVRRIVQVVTEIAAAPGLRARRRVNAAAVERAIGLTVPPTPKIDDIFRTVSDYYGMSITLLRGRSQWSSLNRVRGVAGTCQRE